MEFLLSYHAARDQWFPCTYHKSFTSLFCRIDFVFSVLTFICGPWISYHLMGPGKFS